MHLEYIHTHGWCLARKGEMLCPYRPRSLGMLVVHTRENGKTLKTVSQHNLERPRTFTYQRLYRQAVSGASAKVRASRTRAKEHLFPQNTAFNPPLHVDMGFPVIPSVGTGEHLFELLPSSVVAWAWPNCRLPNNNIKHHRCSK